MTSFTLVLNTRNLSTNARIGINPFTGEEVRFPLDDGLTLKEVAEVRSILKKLKAGKPDPDGYQKIRLGDGGEFNMSCNLLKKTNVSCSLEVNRLTKEVISTIFDLAQAGNLAIRSSIEPNIVALTSPPQNELVAKRWPKATVTLTPDKLETWLKKMVKKKMIV